MTTDPDAAILRRATEVAYKTALAITRDPALAEDIAQDVCVKALTRRTQLRDPNALNAWLYRVAVNESAAAIRRRDRQRNTDRRYATDPTRQHSYDLDPGLQAVIDRLEVLPPQQRAAMVLRHVFDLREQDIAKALGCRVGTASSWLARASATLRAQSESEDQR